MARARRPGTPGKTTIPPDIVSSVTERLSGTFAKQGYHRIFQLFIIPQQGYLYVEVEKRPFLEPTPLRQIKGRGVERAPLGRLRFLGTEERWEYQPYRYSDEYWDQKSPERGTPEDLLVSMVLDVCS